MTVTALATPGYAPTVPPAVARPMAPAVDPPQVAEHLADPPRHPWYPRSGCDSRCRAADGASAWRAPALVTRRAIGLLATVAFIALSGPFVAVMPRVVRRRYLGRMARVLLSSIGLRVRVDDRRPFAGSTRGLIVANHISFLDIFALAVVSPAHMVAKDDVAAMPVISGLARRLGVITIDRSALRALPGTVERAVARLHQDSSVAVFPEGTTWCGRDAGRFRPAFFQAAIDAGVPVIPVRLTFTAADGSVTAAPSLIGDDSPMDTLRRVMGARGLTLHIRVHEVQLPDADRRELAARCEQMVAA
ncbi:lysophospholipid acyltransferase family protein [Gordonia sp. LSe1-13]|uniref:Lysophospholipid acyltransferase family protein n=1 Tax=Gordonia sesuvii TaxID=3116777 RepID=A0ABU7MHV1_9ACTN|nr:lysophospholipid acyltransferase family protein [Gordonia sp. LSe1-13]